MRHETSGVIAVDKPAGVTSRRVVDVVARAVGTRTVGHAGTLDPLARGVVVVCIGHATKLVPYVQELPKRYTATFLLGRGSPSDDLETPVELEADPVMPSRAAIETAAGEFRGDILQRPCDYSAVHVAGRRAYDLARRGRPPDLAPRRVRIDRFDVTAYDWPQVAVDIECSSGTFVRALGRDLATALGTRAVMESLLRTAVGPFEVSAAVPLDAIAPDSVRAAVQPPLACVPHLPRVVLAGDDLDRAVRGGLIDVATLTDGGTPDAVAALDSAGELVGILARLPAGRHRLRPNFHGRG
jgi:tRNA pseudouridine55 synthase